MNKPKKKRSRKRQKSKAAQATEQMRSDRGTESGESGGFESVEYRGTGGMMTRMRGGFQSAVGVNEAQKPKGGLLSNLIWIAVIGAAVFFVFGQYQ
ncbi:MAG: hypothetical protein VX589_04050 [Myxococcota bacterium]|nr:hypothetical protein [Myxococcota bacterium]